MGWLLTRLLLTSTHGSSLDVLYLHADGHVHGFGESIWLGAVRLHRKMLQAMIRRLCQCEIRSHPAHEFWTLNP